MFCKVSGLYMPLVHGTRHTTTMRKYGIRRWRCLRGYAQAISELTSNRLVGRRDPQQVLDEARARLLGWELGVRDGARVRAGVTLRAR